jgi:hypothetical protein
VSMSRPLRNDIAKLEVEIPRLEAERERLLDEERAGMANLREKTTELLRICAKWWPSLKIIPR